MTAPTNGPLTAGAGKITAYAAGSLGTGVFSTVPTALLLYYCTELLHLPAATAGILVFLPKAWAIAWDPLVGARSDRFNSPWGRRAPFLFVGAIGVAIGFVALFSAPPALSAHGLTLWVGTAYFFLATIYSIYAVPYIALPAEIATTKRDRTALVSWRMVAGMAGVFLGAAGVPLLVSALGGGRAGYAGMSWIVAGVCLIAMLCTLSTAPRQAARAEVVAPVSYLQSTRETLAAPGFVRLMIAYYLQITAVGVVTAAMPYLVTQNLGRPESDIGTAFAALIGAAVLTPPFWAWAAHKLGESSSLMTAMFAFGLATCCAGAAEWLHAPWTAALAVMIVAGFGFAGLQVIPFAMLANLASRESEAHGRAREATFTGLWTAGEKLGLASGPALVAAALTLEGANSAPALLVAAPALLLAAASIALIGYSSPRTTTT